MLRKILLVCGVVSSVLYVVADMLGTVRYPGYRYTEQQFSELTASVSPVRPLMLALSVIPYTLLVAPSRWACGYRLLISAPGPSPQPCCSDTRPRACREGG